MQILIIGGYGQFGFRLAKLLGRHSALHITLAGRTLTKAHKACQDLKDHDAHYYPLKFDRSLSVPSQITQNFDVIIDASGPFQAYGDTPYHIAEYAITIGAHYFDIADGAEFVAGLSSLDARARSAKLCVLSGLSTYPCLTAAVANALAKDMARVTHIRAGIAPSPHAVMGKGVIQSILSYGGRPIHDLRGTVYGLSDPQWHTISVPGELPLRPLLFSRVESPESRLLPAQNPSLKSVENRAGPQPVLLHRLLILMARMARYKLLPPLSFFAPLIYKTQALTKMGEHRSGMYVHVRGVDDNGADMERKWGLIAIGDDGPNIPILPIVYMIEALLSGQPLPVGAGAATRAVRLEDYEGLFCRFNMSSGTYEPSRKNDDLYSQVLGTAYQRLPQSIQALHRTGRQRRFSGQAKITRGANPLARVVANIFSFPKAQTDCPVTVTFTRKGDQENWSRDFGGRIMQSTQEAGQGKDAHLIIERFGPISVALATHIENDRLYLTARHWRIFGIKLPRICLPRGDTFEYDAEGRFHFHVEIKVPILGLLVKYQGHLTPDDVEKQKL